MDAKLKQETENAIYFTVEYTLSFHLQKDGKIKAICECGDFVLRKRKECKHTKDAIATEAYAAFARRIMKQ